MLRDTGSELNFSTCLIIITDINEPSFWSLTFVWYVSEKTGHNLCYLIFQLLIAVFRKKSLLLELINIVFGSSTSLSMVLCKLRSLLDSINFVTKESNALWTYHYQSLSGVPLPFCSFFLSCLIVFFFSLSLSGQELVIQLWSNSQTCANTHIHNCFAMLLIDYQTKSVTSDGAVLCLRFSFISSSGLCDSSITRSLSF